MSVLASSSPTKASLLASTLVSTLVRVAAQPPDRRPHRRNMRAPPAARGVAAFRGHATPHVASTGRWSPVHPGPSPPPWPPRGGTSGEARLGRLVPPAPCPPFLSSRGSVPPDRWGRDAPRTAPPRRGGVTTTAVRPRNTATPRRQKVLAQDVQVMITYYPTEAGRENSSGAFPVPGFPPEQKPFFATAGPVAPDYAWR
jgi:hypothetical protein